MGISPSSARFCQQHFFRDIPVSLLHFGANLPRLKVLPVDLPVEPWPVEL